MTVSVAVGRGARIGSRVANFFDTNFVLTRSGAGLEIALAVLLCISAGRSRVIPLITLGLLLVFILMIIKAA